MKSISKEVLNYINKIQKLSIEIENVIVYYQQNIQLFQVYIIEDKIHKYDKSVYIDGYLSNEKQVIEELKKIIKDLEEMKNANRSESKLIV